MSENVGYSGTPLPKKLGIKVAHRVLVLGAPVGFSLGELPDRAVVDQRPGVAPYDRILIFCPDVATLVAALASVENLLHAKSGVWIAWPKKASKVATDLSDDVVRIHGLKAGLVDVKVCAISDIWSGLMFVYRLTDRQRSKLPRLHPA